MKIATFIAIIGARSLDTLAVNNIAFIVQLNLLPLFLKLNKVGVNTVVNPYQGIPPSLTVFIFMVNLNF